jgi:predicted HAD superfamily Cof-like phosphohydrolase
MEIDLFEYFKEEFEMVSQFQKTFDPIVDASGKTIKFRISLITEEGVDEYSEAYIHQNRVKLVDSVCDTLYVILGAYIKVGIPFELSEDKSNEELYNEFKHTLEYYLQKIYARIEFFGVYKWRDAFKEVHRSNMSKGCNTEREALDTINSYLVKGITTHHELINGTYVIYRAEDKKVMKSINYSPAELAPFI